MMTTLSNLSFGSVSGMLRFPRRSLKSSHGFSSARVARAFLSCFLFLLAMPLSQALSKPATQSAQSSSPNEGLKLLAEGLRLEAELGTRSATIEAIEKY